LRVGVLYLTGIIFRGVERRGLLSRIEQGNGTKSSKTRKKKRKRETNCWADPGGKMVSLTEGCGLGRGPVFCRMQNVVLGGEPNDQTLYPKRKVKDGCGGHSGRKKKKEKRSRKKSCGLALVQGP